MISRRFLGVRVINSRIQRELFAFILALFIFGIVFFLPRPLWAGEPGHGEQPAVEAGVSAPHETVGQEEAAPQHLSNLAAEDMLAAINELHKAAGAGRKVREVGEEQEDEARLGGEPRRGVASESTH
jgi:hypothetical protein